MDEFTPIFTQRAVNIIDPRFTQATKNISSKLKILYGSDTIALVPGSGTIGMEAIAREFSYDKKCLIISNGFFGNRWGQILKQGKITSDITILKAQQENGQFQPPRIEQVLSYIEQNQPDIIYLTHVDTSTGILLPEDYIQKIGEAKKHAKLIVDAVASGCIWLDLQKLSVDALVTAPQKGLSSQAGYAIIALNDSLRDLLGKSTSFALDLEKWTQVTEKYETGSFQYHATLPTNAILSLERSLEDIFRYGQEQTKTDQMLLGSQVRSDLEELGVQSVAAPGFQAPSILVHYVNDPKAIVQAYKQQGIHVAGPLAFHLDGEQPSYRIGLLGIDKLQRKDQVRQKLRRAAEKIYSK